MNGSHGIDWDEYLLRGLQVNSSLLVTHNPLDERLGAAHRVTYVSFPK